MRWLRRCRAVRAREVGDLLCEARLAVIRNLEAGPSARSKVPFSVFELPSSPARREFLRTACCRTLRRGSRTTLQYGSARYSCGPDRCVLRHPFMHLTAGWAMHGNGHARKACEQNPLGLKTGCNECTRARALNEYVGQRRTLSGGDKRVRFSRRAPALRTRQDGSARTWALRHRLPCEIC